MKIQISSDLHLKPCSFEIPDTDADAIVLAGDIHKSTRAIDWIRKQTERPVIYVAGNHEFYGNIFPDLMMI
ncbi:metallophosphoesterase family protein [Lentisphaera marina]|uniref:metallophosphoesterase family protein n=1 Tax=Lentisphaera marina TaxID=1111041 RepID=UPI0023661E8F|nr:metallophosphoesterase [Lentisphaera marina]MDD7984338.1 metallophosphoesterase family protein [Lentisphaera marina]